MTLWPWKLRAEIIRLTEHNRLLTESATEMALKLQARDERIRELTGEVAVMAQKVRERDEHMRILSEQIQQKELAINKRALELDAHNRMLIEKTTEAVRELQTIQQNDYQILMGQQQLLAGMKDAEPGFHRLYEKVRPYTMTSIERLYALYKGMEYIVAANLPGDFAEAGVWRGGSCMLMAETLLALGDCSRRIFLLDTFAGHPRPDPEKDIDLWGNRAIDEWQRRNGDGKDGKWSYVSLEEVRANMALTGYPTDKLVFVKGMVEKTVFDIRSMDKLALLRLDSDWHDSTKAALEFFYPRLVSGGILMIDDYGHYKGQQLAVDDYLKAAGEPILLNRVDYSCRLGIKR
jgi:O-methyltransferase